MHQPTALMGRQARLHESTGSHPSNRSGVEPGDSFSQAGLSPGMRWGTSRWRSHQFARTHRSEAPASSRRLLGPSADALPAHETPIFPRQRRVGYLERDDRPFDPQQRDRVVDAYRLRKTAVGQQIHLRLNSRQFDAYLQVVNAHTGEVLFENDDRDGRNSRITFFVQPGVQYQVRVTSSSPGQTGRYALRAKSIQPTIQTLNFAYGAGLVDAAAAVARVLGRSPFPDVSHPEALKTWGIDHIRAPEVWNQGFTGEKVTVAVIDTGVDYSHVDLVNNIWRNPGEISGNRLDDDGNGFVDDVRGWDFVRDDATPRDPHGHGTHIAGAIAAAHNGMGMTGMAYGAKIMPIRVLNEEGFGTQADIARGVRYAVRQGADVINLSLGGAPGTKLTKSLRRALRFARRRGVAVAIAAGNDHQDFGTTHAGEPAYWAASRGLAMAVGATDNAGKIADFSNPMGNRALNYVVAPGMDILSLTPWAQQTLVSMNGTSMATAFVSGVMALMLSAHPDLTPTEIVASLMTTAHSKGLSLV